MARKRRQKKMTTTPQPDDRIPVIVGVGEITDRPKEITDGLEPLTLLERSAQTRRSRQRRGKLLGEIDSLDVVNFLSWRYRDPEKQLARAPRHRAEARSITARSAARARSAICMRRPNASRAANAASPRSAAPRRSPPRPRPSAPASTLPWTPFAHDVEEPKRGAAFQKPMAVKLGVFRPVSVYPFYEAAASAHWGQTPREAMAESGRAVVGLFASRLAKSQCLAEAALHAGGNHDAFAGQPADRLALHQTDGGQSDRQHGRRGAADEPRQSARGRHRRASADSRHAAARRRKSRAIISIRDQFFESHAAECGA